MTRAKRKQLEWMIAHGTPSERLQAYETLYPDEVKAAQETPAVVPDIPLPNGIGAVLSAKSELERHMSAGTKTRSCIVSVDVYDGGWCYVARGPDPGIRLWVVTIGGASVSIPVFWHRNSGSGKFRN